MRKLNKLFAMLVAMLGVSTLSAQTDVTSTYLTNADLSSLDGWTRTDYTDYKTDGDANVIEFYHTWSANPGADIGNTKNFYFKQNVTLPAGEYRLAVNAFYREGNGNGTNTKAYIFAGEQQQYIIGLNSGALTSYTGSNDLYKAANAFSQGAFSNAFDFTVEEETSMEIGFNGYINTYCSWCILGPVKLYQYSMDDFNNELIAARTKLQGVTGLNAAMTAKVETVLSETENVTQTKAAILEATAKVNAMYNNVVAEFLPSYNSLNGFVELCTNCINNSNANSTDVQTNFQSAIQTATSAMDAAENVSTLNTVYDNLEVARQTYVLNAFPLNGVTFDLSFKLTTTWENGGNNYTAGGVVMKEKYAEQPYTGDVMWTSITDLPNGTYDAEVYCNANACEWNFTSDITDGAKNSSVTANNIVIPVPVYKLTSNNTANVVTLADVVVKDHTMNIKIKNDVIGANWVLVAHKSLILKAGLDVSEQQTTVTELLTEANTLTLKAMNSIVKAELTTAINGADATNENPDELESMIETLSTAIADANASIADYEKILTYITKANGIDASIAAEYQAQYENRTISETAETVFQNLEVATYNYITENFTYAVALSDTWNSTGTNTEAATFNNEHWSGTTSDYKNQKDGTGMGWQASAWTIDFDQEVTLPAGKYVFKVAGRKSADATLSLVVTQGETTLGTVNDFPSSNNSVGINKAGATSFDTNDAAGFANNGNGFGWQWRYVMFELDAEATVKVAVHAETSMIHNWVSFGDYTLQMTEETYLEANKGGVEVAEAAAQALVDTTPMGDAENEALKAALAMTYNTGAEMLAKVNALETAVANANAWVTAYNEAKAPLVAALERFEADYNDGENGAKDHMAKSRWETVLAMVQAAAEAKDVTNSYEGFAAATENLVDALDAATVSVNEYAALDEAIKAATALAEGANWGDEPFQRPESAKAGLDTADEQAVYDAAEADGEGVTALTEALDAAVETANNVTLNAPAAGDAFYITVATEGHSLLGNYIVASLGTTGANNPTGYGFNASVDNTYNPFTKVYTFEQVEGNNYRISVKVNAETVYLTVGSLNGSAAGWNQQQIQGTTDVAKAAEFEVEASTSKSGVIKLRNTVYDNYLDCQAGGSIYTDTEINNEDFALTLVDELQASVAVSISEEINLSTCVLMFDAQLPAELEAYVGVSVENDCLILQKVEGVLPAYTPCLLYAETGYEGTLEGTVEKGSYTATTVIGDFLCGAIDKTVITEGYVMQNQADYGVGFFNVASEKTIPVGKCWLSKETLDATPAAVGMRFINGGATKLNPVLMDKAVLDGAIYTIDGKRVNSMERGQIYIISGQKVMIK